MVFQIEKIVTSEDCFGCEFRISGADKFSMDCLRSGVILVYHKIDLIISGCGKVRKVVKGICGRDGYEFESTRMVLIGVLN